MAALNEEFEKLSLDWEEAGDVGAPLAGAFNPLMSGLISGATDPGDRSLQTGVLTGLGSLGGTAVGGLLGGGLGWGAGRLAESAGMDVDPRMAAILLGSIGSMAGGAGASHFARQKSKDNQTAKKKKRK